MGTSRCALRRGLMRGSVDEADLAGAEQEHWCSTEALLIVMAMIVQCRRRIDLKALARRLFRRFLVITAGDEFLDTLYAHACAEHSTPLRVHLDGTQCKCFRKAISGVGGEDVGSAKIVELFIGGLHA